MEKKTDTDDKDDPGTKDDSKAKADGKSEEPDKGKDEEVKVKDEVKVEKQTQNDDDFKNAVTKPLAPGATRTVVNQYAEKINSNLDTLTSKVPAINLIEDVIQSVTAAARVSASEARPLFKIDSGASASLDIVSPTSTPFKLSEDIPRLFELTTVVNDKQTLDAEVSRVKDTVNSIDQIVQSYAIFNNKTMTVRVVPRSTINGVSLGDPNTFEKGVIEIEQTQSEYTNMQPYASWLEAKLKYIMKAFKATDNVVHMIPSKLVVNPTYGPTEIHRAVSTMSLWKGDYAHIYLSSYNATEPWMIQWINDMYKKAPIMLGESDAKTFQGSKISARISAITDQWAAAIATLQFDRLSNSQLDISEYRERLKANMFENDEVHIPSHISRRITTLLYSPSKIEWDLMMYYIMAHRPVRDALFPKIHELIMETDRFKMYRLEEVWQSALATNNISSDINQRFLESMNVGDQHTPYQMVILETFSDWFDFQLDLGSLPTDWSCVIDIMAVLFFQKLFPQISQQVINQLGYRMNQLLLRFVQDRHIAFESVYGDTCFEGKSQPVNGRMLTDDEVQQGITYSIYGKFVHEKARAGVDTTYLNWLSEMQKLVQPKIYETTLYRKATSRYPYYNESKKAFASWSLLPTSDLMGENRTELVRDLLSIVKLVSKLADIRSGGNKGFGAMPKPTQIWMQTFWSNLNNLLTSASAPFEYTARSMQDALMNGAFFVYQRYNPHTPFKKPTNLVITPERARETATGVPIQKSVVYNLDIFSALRMALTLEGDIVRNIQTGSKGNPGSSKSLPTPLKERKILIGRKFDDLAMGVLFKARQFGAAMQFLQWVTDYTSSTNPIQSIAIKLKNIMKMSNWVPLAKLILGEFGLNFEDYYINNALPRSGVYDGRDVSLTIRELSPQTLQPIWEGKAGTIFGKKVAYMDSYAYTHINLLSRMFVNTKSPVLNVVNGIYVGRFLVDELAPNQPFIEAGWDVIEFEQKDETGKVHVNVRIENVDKKGGFANALSVRKNKDAKWQRYMLPYDRNIGSKGIMIHMKSFSQFYSSYKKILAEAIHFGWLAFKVDEAIVSATIEDKESRTTDYSEDLSVAELTNLISTPDGELISRKLCTTKYATNFTSNARVITHYIQWVVTMEDADKNLVAAVLNAGVSKTEQTVLPTVDMLEYGQVTGTYSMNGSDNVPKVDKNVINWNNCYPALGKAALAQTVEVDYKASQPAVVLGE